MLFSTPGYPRAALHDVATGAELRRFVGHTQAALAVAFAPDSVHALSSERRPHVPLWEVETGKSVRVFHGHTAPITAVVFTSRRAVGVVGESGPHRPRLWDVQTAQELHRFEGHTGPVTALALTRDGIYAASGGEDKVVTIWNVTKRQVAGHVHPNGITEGISDLEIFSRRRTHANLLGLQRCAGVEVQRQWHPAGPAVARPHRQGGHGQPLRRWATALSGSYDKTACLWDVASSQELRRLEGHAAPVMHVRALSPDGRYASTGSGDHIVHLWELANP